MSNIRNLSNFKMKSATTNYEWNAYTILDSTSQMEYCWDNNLDPWIANILGYLNDY